MESTTLFLAVLTGILGAMISWARFAKNDDAQIHSAITESAATTVESMQVLIDELKSKIDDMEVELCLLKEQNERLLAENEELRMTIDNLIAHLEK